MALPAAFLVGLLLSLHLPEAEPMTYHIALPGGIQAGTTELAVLTFYDLTYGVTVETQISMCSNIPVSAVETGISESRVGIACSDILPNGIGIAAKGIKVESFSGDDFTLLVSMDDGADGYLALPDEHLGTEYYVLTYCETGGMCQFSVVATADDTSVSIQFPVGVQTNEVCITSPGTVLVDSSTSISFTLNEFDVLYFESDQELSGTHIKSSQTISVLAGAKDVPGLDGDTTTISEQMLPVNNWGREFYIVPNENNDMGDLIKIITKANNTRIEISGYSPFVVGQGEVVVRRLDWGMPSMVKANNPIMIIQVMSVDLYNGSNSVHVRPALLLVQALTQWTDKYLSYCPNPDKHTISIVSTTDDINSIIVENPHYTAEINGTEIPGTDKSFYTVNASTLGSEFIQLTGTNFAAYGYCNNRAAFNLGLSFSNSSEDCHMTNSMPGDGIDNDCDGQTDEEQCVDSDLVTSYYTAQNPNGSITYYTDILNGVDFLTVTIVTCGVLHIKLHKTTTSSIYATIQITETTVMLELCDPACVDNAIYNISPKPCDQSREFVIRTKLDLTVVAYDQQEASLDLGDVLFDYITFSALVNSANITVDKTRKDCGKITNGDADNLGLRFVVPCNHLEDDFVLFVSARADTDITVEELPQGTVSTFTVLAIPGTKQILKSQFSTQFKYLVLTAVQDVELSVHVQRTSGAYIYVTWTELIPLDVTGPAYQTYSTYQSEACRVIPTDPYAEVNFFSPTLEPIRWGDTMTAIGDGIKYITGSSYPDDNFIHGDKPIAVFCINVNDTVLQMPPHESLGKTHYIPKLNLGFAWGMTSAVRIVTSEHSTTININGEYDETTSIDVKGSNLTRDIASDTLYEILADKPILVILEVYSTTSSSGWSSAVVIPPANLYKDTHRIPVLPDDYSLKPSSAVDSSGVPVTSQVSTLTQENHTVTYPNRTLSITFMEYTPANKMFMLISDRLYNTINQDCVITNGSVNDGEDNDCDGFIDEDTCQQHIVPGLLDYDIDGSINEDCGTASADYSAVPNVILLPENVATCPTLTTSTTTSAAAATQAPSGGSGSGGTVAPATITESENISLGPIPPSGDVVAFTTDISNETCYTDCMCPCGWTAVQNYTEEEIADMVKEIQMKLRLNKQELSAQVRKKISAQDDRTSATAIGYVGLAFMLVSIGSLVVLDLTMIARHLKMLHGTVRQICGRT